MSRACVVTAMMWFKSRVISPNSTVERSQGSRLTEQIRAESGVCIPSSGSGLLRWGQGHCAVLTAAQEREGAYLGSTVLEEEAGWSHFRTISPLNSITSRRTPWAAGCWGPKFRVRFDTNVSFGGSTSEKCGK
ncbi:hypothetical protein Cadr_000024530 [Camelus dromedarius]|uniref:Uncharacterized protein n=1 Tax=Camelus dromedarius TaxID=9838 RepID=A0A5N4CMQ9_CAMDR|nr:hypothetical protein Cadr_000024530 [Camelus dromedarius]